MQKYVIICETMHRAKCLWNSTLYSLGDLVVSFDKRIIFNIETSDGLCLYFVSEDYWFRRGGRFGRHDWEPLGANYFERMLDEWKESK